MSSTNPFIQKLLAAFQTLTPEESELLAVAMLHGVPVRQIVERTGLPADETQDAMIAALRKLRKAMDAEGCSAAQLQEQMQSRVKIRPSKP